MIKCVYVTNDNVKHYAAAGISAADLPLEDVGTGSACAMLDTGERYIFHRGVKQWFKQPNVQSGGKTPVRGVDYWTEEDIALIRTYVDEAIAGGKW